MRVSSRLAFFLLCIKSKNIIILFSGVIGEKCDHCPYRWVLILNQGCFECDKCAHNLLDTTDYLRELIDPVIRDFEAVASGYFTSKRLSYINNTYNELKPKVNVLSESQQGDIFEPIILLLEPTESEAKNLNRRANFSANTGINLYPEANNLRKHALEALNGIRIAAIKANKTIDEINALSFDNNEGPKIDQALAEADYIVKEIRKYNLSLHEDDADEELEKAKDVLDIVLQFQLPVEDQNAEWKKLKMDIENFNKKLDDLMNHTTIANNKIAEIHTLDKKFR